MSVWLLFKSFRNFLENYRIIEVNNMTVMIPSKTPLRQTLSYKDPVLSRYKCIPPCSWRKRELSDLGFLISLNASCGWFPFLREWEKKKKNSSKRIRLHSLSWFCFIQYFLKHSVVIHRSSWHLHPTPSCWASLRNYISHFSNAAVRKVSK